MSLLAHWDSKVVLNVDRVAFVLLAAEALAIPGLRFWNCAFRNSVPPLGQLKIWPALGGGIWIGGAWNGNLRIFPSGPLRVFFFYLKISQRAVT